MAYQQVFRSPTNPNFFQPLLPGFRSHLSIPLNFFSRHIEGRNKKNMVELTSDASEKTWRVKREGRKLTVGWKDFADSHDFRVGDIIIFRHEGDFLFHVTVLGPNCCEIQYVQSSKDDVEEEENIRTRQNLKTEPNDGDKNNMGKPMYKDEEKRRKTGESSQSENRFVTLTIPPSSLKDCGVYLPRSFTRVHKMEEAGVKEITMLDKDGVEWPVNLCVDKKYSRVRLGTRAKAFFTAIGVRANESVVLELVWEDKTSSPMFKFCSKIKT